MNDDVVQNRNWWRQNRRWFLPLVTIAIITTCVAVAGIAKSGDDFVAAFLDEALYKNAVAKCNQDKHVSDILGILAPIDEMAILESDAQYSEDKRSVKLTVRVKGDKATGRMDVVAHKIDNKWEYDKIRVRIKNPKREIVVI
jgi:hypothetical protein